MPRTVQRCLVLAIDASKPFSLQGRRSFIMIMGLWNALLEWLRRYGVVTLRAGPCMPCSLRIATVASMFRHAFACDVYLALRCALRICRAC